mmetsp:Transcript_2738/g.4125  ORF Transcript_2738/g.4125 Transcript_2738/m.4125 type:complete len:323 (-) Transcript_2738:132-1100(-)
MITTIRPSRRATSTSSKTLLRNLVERDALPSTGATFAMRHSCSTSLRRKGPNGYATWRRAQGSVLRFKILTSTFIPTFAERPTSWNSRISSASRTLSLHPPPASTVVPPPPTSPRRRMSTIQSHPMPHRRRHVSSSRTRIITCTTSMYRHFVSSPSTDHVVGQTWHPSSSSIGSHGVSNFSSLEMDRPVVTTLTFLILSMVSYVQWIVLILMKSSTLVRETVHLSVSSLILCKNTLERRRTSRSCRINQVMCHTLVQMLAKPTDCWDTRLRFRLKRGSEELPCGTRRHMRRRALMSVRKRRRMVWAELHLVSTSKVKVSLPN